MYYKITFVIKLFLNVHKVKHSVISEGLNLGWEEWVYFVSEGVYNNMFHLMLLEKTLPQKCGN
jgi:hypothetical protein